jgi:Concanavalin A-like lectin/glucanases superfamily
MSDSFNSFSTSSSNSGNNDFLASNSLVAKFAFLLLVIFIFIVLFRVGLSIIAWASQPNESPKLINGMVNANQTIVFQQDPSANGSTTIYRSNNAADGIEFTWSVWIFIDDLTYLQGQYKNIFYKGNSNITSTGLNFPNNAPGLYITPNANNLVVIMNTFNVINEEVLIPDIPLNKWVNVIIRCENTTLDVYINGTIARSVQLSGIPKQNYGDVYVAANGGFGGNISNLWYYNYALGTSAIQAIAANGPNTTITGSNPINYKDSNYLSLRWFFYGSGDGFNPPKFMPPQGASSG